VVLRAVNAFGQIFSYKNGFLNYRIIVIGPEMTIWLPPVDDREYGEFVAQKKVHGRVLRFQRVAAFLFQSEKRNVFL